MCRINGILSYKYHESKETTASITTAMRDTMIYGGPDDAGIYVDDFIALGHRRLSILDLSSAGHQPMQWQSYVIVYNGEVYNFKEIRDSLEKQGYTFETNTDTEVILKGYHCWGKELVQRFRGMFAFAIWDKQEKKLLLCRDRVGVKPLYWYWKDGLLMFASELKAFHEHPSFDKTIDHDAVALYLQQGYIHAPHCIFRYAHKLLPGHFLEADVHGTISTTSYWDAEVKYAQNTLLQTPALDIQAELEEILVESFRLRMVADVPVGMFLSGGIDSSLVVALLQRYTNQQVKTFTIGFWDKSMNEAPYASAIAQHIGTAHTEYYCDEQDFLALLPQFTYMYDEPFGDSSGIPTYLVSKMASEQVKVSLSADGGDELFGGYTKYAFSSYFFKTLSSMPLPIRQFLASKDISWLERNATQISILNKYKGVSVKLKKFFGALGSTDVIDFFNRSSQFLTDKELAQFTPHHINRFTNQDIKIEPARLLTLLGMIDIKLI